MYKSCACNNYDLIKTPITGDVNSDTLLKQLMVHLELKIN